ncbi:MAG: dephospho-CoA kinase [Acidobacteria bacterium]|nr:dephospho-CoA kinase [Acidobacteriota bacterium]MBI3263920.1 dephospho-CoA kinase [Acidobacteriota bacterium]
MLRVALTGGIATGKSYVAERLQQRGLPAIDADRLVHELLMPESEAIDPIVARFGREVLDEDGSISRRVLGRKVFADPVSRRDLEAILHPRVYDRIHAWFATLAGEGRHRVAVADIPLLYESRREREFDRVIVVACDAEEQVRRAMKRDHLPESEARQRLAAQLPIVDKVRRADYVVWTTGTHEETDRQVDDIVRTLAAVTE